jgi:ubiquinone/menaquinone biosynthesis C-methylase UbiE
LTNSAVELARRNFAARGLVGRFETADARRLPFAASYFDHVYSFGVIHHSPDPRAIAEEGRTCEG